MRPTATHDEDASGSTFPAPNAGGAGGGLKGLYIETKVEVEPEDILIALSSS